MQHDDIHDRGQDDPELEALLKDYPMPAASENFFDQALVRATHEGSRRQRNRWLLTGFSAALAAGVVFWMVGGFMFTSPNLPTEDGTIPSIAMTVEEPRTVNLVFASAEKLDTATLTVSLPDGLELSGFPGQREVTWETSLNAGKNLLPLRLIATSPIGGELLATLEHDERGRTFRLQVNVS